MASPSLFAKMHKRRNLRAKWIDGSIQERYIRFGGAGDCFTGRVVCGLPQGEDGFLVLPPHFERDCREVDAICSRVFTRNLWEMTSLKPVLRACLASLVKHKEFLTNYLPGEAQLFNKLPFSDPEMMDKLERRLWQHEYKSPHMHATGIPTDMKLYINIRDQMSQESARTAELREMVSNMKTQLASIPESCSALIMAKIDASDMEKGELNAANLQRLMNEQMHRHQESMLEGMDAIVRKSLEETLPLGGLPGRAPPPGEPAVQTGTTYSSFSWPDDPAEDPWQHRLPHTFALGPMKCLAGWELWLLGHKGKNYCPYRLVQARDIPPGKEKTQFGRYKRVMRALEAEVKARGEWEEEDLTREGALRTFSIAIEGLSEKFPTAKKKRIPANTMAVSTIAVLLGLNKRAPTPAQPEE